MNLIKNGSFENAAKGYSPPTGNGESLANGSTAIAGWTVFGGLADDGLAWLTNGNAYGVSTPYKSDFLDLTGYHDGQPYFGVEQTIKTVAGVTYDLTFRLGEDNGSVYYSGPVSVEAAAGSTSQKFKFASKQSGNVWKSFTLEFTATSTNTLISIQGLSGDQYIGLDDVAVKPATQSPSPSGFVNAMAALHDGAGSVARTSGVAGDRMPTLVNPHTAVA